MAFKVICKNGLALCYLSAYYHFVCIVNEIFDLAEVKCSVPQVSVLGPFLFFLHRIVLIILL